MKEEIKRSWRKITKRWRNAMPRFFRVIFWVCTLVSGTAIAANSAITLAGGTTHDWWNDLFPYLVGIPAGAAFVAKFTQQYHGKAIDYDEYRKTQKQGNTILDHDNF